jgi:hypothetical protein
MNADLLIRAGAIYSMDGHRGVYHVAVKGERIVGVSSDRTGLDHLIAKWIQQSDGLWAERDHATEVGLSNSCRPCSSLVRPSGSEVQEVRDAVLSVDHSG